MKGAEVIRKEGRGGLESDGGGGRMRWQHSATSVNLTLIRLLSSYKHTGVEPEALPGPVPSGPAGPLAGRGLGDGGDHQGLDGRLRIVGAQLHESAVDDEHDAVDGDGGLGYVGGHHDLGEAEIRPVSHSNVGIKKYRLRLSSRKML